MHCFEKYRLLRLSSPLRQDLCLEGNIPGTATEITLHYLSSDNRGEDDAVLLKAELLAPEFRAQVLELGYENGTPFVVTRRLPDGLSLRTWVLQSLIETQRRAAGAIPQRELAREVSDPQVAPAATGEFTRFLRVSSGQEIPLQPPLSAEPPPSRELKVVSLPSLRTAAAHSAGPPPVTGAGATGEFTKFLRTVDPTPARLARMPESIQVPPEQTPGTAPATLLPGTLPSGVPENQDATKIFQRPMTHGGFVNHAGSLPRSLTGQGEYTMMIQQQEAQEFAGLGRPFSSSVEEAPGSAAPARASVTEASPWKRYLPILAIIVILGLLAAVVYLITSVR